MMEAYKATCKACGRVYSFTDYKTGMYKTAEQLAAMDRRRTICRYCGAAELKVGLDHETDLGRDLDEGVASVLAIVAAHLDGKTRP